MCPLPLNHTYDPSSACRTCPISFFTDLASYFPHYISVSVSSLPCHSRLLFSFLCPHPCLHSSHIHLSFPLGYSVLSTHVHLSYILTPSFPFPTYLIHFPDPPICLQTSLKGSILFLTQIPTFIMGPARCLLPVDTCPSPFLLPSADRTV